MTTMTSEEVMASSASIMKDWFNLESLIIETCGIQEDEMDKIYEDTPYMSPFVMATVQLAKFNLTDGWTKKELMDMLNDVLPDDE